MNDTIFFRMLLYLSLQKILECIVVIALQYKCNILVATIKLHLQVRNFRFEKLTVAVSDRMASLNRQLFRFLSVQYTLKSQFSQCYTFSVVINLEHTCLHLIFISGSFKIFTVTIISNWVFYRGVSRTLSKSKMDDVERIVNG